MGVCIPIQGPFRGSNTQSCGSSLGQKRLFDVIEVARDPARCVANPLTACLALGWNAFRRARGKTTTYALQGDPWYHIWCFAAIAWIRASGIFLGNPCRTRLNFQLYMVGSLVPRTRPGQDPGNTRARPGGDPDQTRSRPGQDPGKTRARPGPDPGKTRGRPRELRGNTSAFLIVARRLPLGHTAWRTR
jgi:hypothetical protein